MTSGVQAKRYAQAIFQIARQNNDFDRWLADLQMLANLQHETAFVQALETPKIKAADKELLLRERFPEAGQLALNLLNLLVEKRRILLLPNIWEEMQRLVDEDRGIVRAEVRTAIDMSDEEKRHLEKHLTEITGKTATVTGVVDPKLIGGMVARFEGKLLDASTKSRLEAMRKEISNTPR